MDTHTPAILIVCTANICRSPMAEGLLSRQLDQQGIPAHVASAGLTTEGQPPHPFAVEALQAGWNIDIGDRTSHTLDRQIVEVADLVVTMERHHVREIAALAPDTWPRTFTLKELVSRGNQAGPRLGHIPMDEWLLRVAAGRRPTDLVDVNPDDDISDPIGNSKAVFHRTAEELDDLLARLVDLAWPTL